MTSTTSPQVRQSRSEPKLRGSDLIHPSLLDFSYLDCQRRAELLAQEGAKLCAVRNLLDVGGQGKPYACFFKDRVANHFVLDVSPAASVDVVGDGRSNQGIAPGPIRDRMASANITINGLCILHEEPDLLTSYSEEVIGGRGAFAVTCATYADFTEAMRQKLARELKGPIA